MSIVRSWAVLAAESLLAEIVQQYLDITVSRVLFGEVVFILKGEIDQIFFFQNSAQRLVGYQGCCAVGQH